MQAIILAAGMGTRLRPTTDNLPKCMVKVSGTPIVVNALTQLARFGVNETIIVVGHKKEVVMEAIGNRFYGMKITYVANDDYDTTNNIYSLWLARDLITEDLLLLEGDIFFEARLIEEALKDENKNVVLVDNYQPYMDGTLLEVNDDYSIKRMIPKKDQGAEFDFTGKFKTVNVYHFTRDFFSEMFKPILETYIKTQPLSQFYELVLGVLVYIGNPRLYARLVDQARWYEIDDHNDLTRAEYLFSSPEERLETIDSIYGGYWRYDFIDFNYLYNLYFPPQRAYNEIGATLPALLGNYPSGLDQIRKFLTSWISVPFQDITVGNGASELIRVINRLFVKKITIPVPGFNEYENRLTPDQVNNFFLKEDSFRLDPHRFVKSVKDSGSNAALIVNPNNPTSMYVDKEDMRFILSELKGLDLIMVDESFINFVDREADPSLESGYREFNNLVIIKSVSKGYGVPGLRLGYALSSNRGLIDAISRELPIWNINSPAEYFLEVFIKYRAEFEESCKKIIKDREQLLAGLKTVSYLKTFPAQANYVFAGITDSRNPTELKNRLFLRHNLLIKDCSNKTGLDDKGYVRLTVRTEKENNLLLKALKGLTR